MGKKRNERRLAAKIGAGRRVKLDLFAEPSGDLGDSSPKDEVEREDMDAKHDPELPNSPSSGQRLENPLSLLGQYSDDELDDSSDKAEGESHDNKQAIESITGQFEEGEIGENDDQSFHKADNQCRQNDSALAMVSQVVDTDDTSQRMATYDEKNNEVDVEKQDPTPLTLDVQASGDLDSVWKMVLHEDSNRYYYWNTVTGETSWDIPEGYVQGSAAADGLDSSRNIMESSSGEVYNTTGFGVGVGVDELPAGHGLGFTNGVSQISMVYEQVAPGGHSVQQSKGDGNQLGDSSVEVGGLSHETSTVANYMLPGHYSGTFGDFTTGNYALHGDSALSAEHSIHLPSQLAKQGETLLQNLKLLLGSGSDPGKHALLSRYISEIEVRLLDIRALLPYGPSLLPFWVHTEKELNQLENSINTEIGKQDIISNRTNLTSSEVNNVQQKGKGDNSSADASLTNVSPEILSTAADEDATAKVPKSSHAEVSHCLGIDAVVSDTTHDDKTNSKLDSQAFEDVDMDIDMEVEASSPPMGAQLEDPSKLAVHPSASGLGESLIPESDFVAPPPPEEEWIPPPPPDDEGIPPPPPNEPPEASFTPPLPSEPEAVQVIYGEHYCYENMTTASSTSTLYEHAGTSQTAAISLPVYFGTAQPHTVMPSPADGIGNCGLQNGLLSAIPTADAIGSSTSLSYDSTSVEGTWDDASAGVCSMQIANPLSTSAMSGMYLETSTTVSKGQSKVSRMKKPKVSVASSFRSNKKVSNLVDKWKAAKEELEEEEEKRETPLELLERKRQREIEEWRAQQIASGEAKENANFQPLGGNWRERVKRRRAQKEATTTATTTTTAAAATETPSDPSNKGMKQPDLKSLSKDLPFGWQVYWDDSSKQIYYSNSITSETTWTRPTR